MSMTRVVVGVCGDDVGTDGWLRLLEQERLPYERVDGPTTELTLFSDWLPDWFESYVSGGGIAIVSGATETDGVFPTPENAVIHRYVSPVDNRTSVAAPTVTSLFPGDGFGECRLHEDRKVKGGIDPDVYPAVLEQPLGRGHIIFTGIPLTRLITAGGDSLRQVGMAAQFTERVASVDKAEICDTLEWMLRRGFAHWSVPYPRIGRFPHGHRSVFILRVDVDGVFGNRTRRIAEIASGHGIRASFFFNGSLCDEHPGELGSWIRDHDIGQHGYLHNVFESVGENLSNVEDGHAWVVENIEVEPYGFVAPRGLWNSALDRALAKRSYPYSSDFSLDFDSLPFRTSQGTLQIPVHPYSPERATVQAVESGHRPPTPSEVLDHYVRVIDRQIERDRPAYIYGHPEVLGTMADDVLPTLFAAGIGRLTAMTVHGFYEWWATRETVTATLDYDADRGHLRARVMDQQSVTLELLDHPTLEVDLNDNRFELAASDRSVVPVGRGLEPGGES